MAAADALAVLASNAGELQKIRAELQALTDGQIAELIPLCGEDPTAAFRRVFGDSLCCREFASFCRRLICGRTDPALLTRLLPDYTVIAQDYAEPRTAYVRSGYADRAFARFSQAIPRLSAQYQPTFAAACEEVYYDRCQYCILPLQTTDDGVLPSFSRMMAKYELKITRIADVPMQDGDATARFALLRRGIAVCCPSNGFFEAGFVLPEGIGIGNFLAAAEETGARIDRIRTMPLSYTDDAVSLDVTFRISPDSAAPLMLFLRSVLSGYTPEGIFSAD